MDKSREPKLIIFYQVQQKKFSKDGLMDLVRMAVPEDDDRVPKIEEIADVCQKMEHEDRCKQALMISKCMEAEAKKKNMKME